MSYKCLFYHVVFSTKQRRPFLSGDALPRICQYMGGIARNLDCRILLAHGMPDHVHLAASVHPTVAVADFVRNVKSNASGWVHKTFPDLADFAWQDGYAAFTVSPSVMPNVKEYIQAQAEHHKTMTFQEELIALLETHGVEYDKRYVRA